MDQAIITGSTGFIGNALAKHLISKKIDVICIGKQELNDDQILNLFGKKVKYVTCLMQNIETLQILLKNKLIKVGNKSCFFH